MPRYPCQQYSDHRVAGDRRKHLNLLLSDYCTQQQLDSAATSVQPSHAPSLEYDAASAPARLVWAAAYKEGGPEAARLCTQVPLSLPQQNTPSCASA